MERESKEIDDLKRKFIEVVKVANRLKSEFGEGSVWLDVPKNNYENMYIDVNEQEGVLRWWVGFGEKSYIRSYKLDIKELEKDIKEIELGLLKDIQDVYRKRDEEIKDNIERLKVRIKEQTAMRKSQIGKWFKVKQLIEELQ